MTYLCPVCGYDDLTQPPKNFSICDCCGTEFESDDFDRSHEELRIDWISNNLPWFSRSVVAPKNWSPYRQLIIADHGTDLIEHPRFDNELDFRSEVNKSFSEVFISKQLKALREREEEPLTQTQLADKAGMKQSRISELEGMNYSSWSISTVERLAKALGVAFTYRFEAWRDLVGRIEYGLSNETLAIPSFERDMSLTSHGVFIRHDVSMLDTPYGELAESDTGLRLGGVLRDDAWQIIHTGSWNVRRSVFAGDELLPEHASINFFQSVGADITSLAVH